jgi:hypothetical protein
MANTRAPGAAEARRERTLERRRQNAAILVQGTDVVARSAPSFLAQVQGRAVPIDLVRQGRIAPGEPNATVVALYDPKLIAPNPQRGRVIDERLDELAASLDAHGQQESIVCRLLTDTDRQRWPDSFNDHQILVILKGHRLYFAQPKSRLQQLKAEVMFPIEGEDDVTYMRRALRRAAIKMMHSQEYTLLDKVNLYDQWIQEFSLAQPKKAEIARYFEISETEAQRIKVVAQLDEKVAQDILNSGMKPADEIIYLIANQPPEQHREAYEKLGDMTVAAARRALKEGDRQSESRVTGSGRPRNYYLSVQKEDSPIAYVSTTLTAKQWTKRGGAKAFWEEVRHLVNDRRVQERLQEDLS